jgi:hypothetical protein
MRLGVAARFNEVHERGPACFKFCGRKATSKKLVPQPDAIGVHNVAFAVLGDLPNAPFAIVSLHIRAADPVRLTGLAHHAT